MRKLLFVMSVLFLSFSTVFLQGQETGKAAGSEPDSKTSVEQEASNSDEENLQDEWKLKYHEDFSKDLEVDESAWVRDHYGEDSPWTVDGELDDNGRFFHIKGGEDFVNHLDSFWLMRKRVAFGENNWLTTELASRDYTKAGQPENGVSFDNATLPDGNEVAKIDEPSHDGGALIRSTEPLPPEYRIEYKLKTIDFGGMRNGSFSYDGKINGYDTEGTKTNFPWKPSGSFAGPSDPSNSNFGDVRGENGFYFLSIVDYHNPAPHNNVFIHNHRKVNMDAYNVNGLWSDDYSVCNPETGDLYNYNSNLSTRNGINALFMNGDKYKDHVMPYTDFLMETECGSHEGTIVSAAEIQPELMPNEDYTFAIERNETGYTMEMSGNFLHVGNTTLRYERDFIEDGQPIFHFNNTPDQYDGQYDKTWDDGEYEIENTWPENSAYPDYFIIGDPHLTHYEGSASIDDIKLYVPEEIGTEYIKTRIWQLKEAGEFNTDQVYNDLKIHLEAVNHFEKNNDSEKVVKHMKGFKTLLTYQENNDLITQEAYESLKRNADTLIEGRQ